MSLYDKSLIHQGYMDGYREGLNRALFILQEHAKAALERVAPVSAVWGQAIDLVKVERAKLDN